MALPLLNQSIEQSIPHDIEAEQALLGSILLDNASLNSVLGILEERFFYLPAHQHIYNAIVELSLQDSPFDEILIGDFLKQNSKLEDCGSYTYLSELIDLAPSVSNIEYYAKIIRDHALLRDLIRTSQDIAHQSRDPQKNVAELLAEASNKINEIAVQSGERNYTHIEEILIQNFDQLEKLSAQEGDITGVPTGFTDLDKITFGLQASDLIIVAGRPSMGKTAFALNIAQYAASRTDSKKAVVIFSLEMSKEQIASRMLVSEAKVPIERLRSGHPSKDDWDKLAIATQKISQYPLYINDSSGITSYELITICNQINKDLENGIGLIVVDYLQLMKGTKNIQNREQEIAEISRSLKGLARKLNVPVIALSQLNRTPETRAEKRPLMSDLRESGALEQDADIIMFIYRDEVYHEDTPDKGIAEIIIGKHRNGSLGTVRLAFIGKYTKFANFSGREIM